MLNIQKSVTYVLNQECYLCFDCAPEYGIRNTEYGIAPKVLTINDERSTESGPLTRQYVEKADRAECRQDR
jgi:hypothetical protein